MDLRPTLKGASLARRCRVFGGLTLLPAAHRLRRPDRHYRRSVLRADRSSGEAAASKDIVVAVVLRPRVAQILSAGVDFLGTARLSVVLKADCALWGGTVHQAGRVRGRVGVEVGEGPLPTILAFSQVVVAAASTAVTIHDFVDFPVKSVKVVLLVQIPVLHILLKEKWREGARIAGTSRALTG